MPKFKHCFIMENGTYKEIPYDTLFLGEERNPQFQTRYFLPFHDCLMEVSEADYKENYRQKRRQKYLLEEAIAHNELSFDALDTDDQSGLNTLVDHGAISIDELVATKIMVEKLHEILGELSESERELIKNLFFDGLSERQLSKKTGVAAMTIHDRKVKVLVKLKKLLKNYK
ncbi:sigma-70 family RNA polymerase sigma factor [Bengtsoniella intestinalis]|uniref:sigma-70 family RNA polymerase sigma factor n=1 Tax=Bengtsoniella intestinalis TaxID=3073143 RepID=UPI00391F994E